MHTEYGQEKTICSSGIWLAFFKPVTVYEFPANPRAQSGNSCNDHTYKQNKQFMSIQFSTTKTGDSNSGAEALLSFTLKH